MTKESTRVTLQDVRFSYAHVFKPYAFDGDSEKADYSVQIIIDKTNHKALADIKYAIELAKERGRTSRWGGTIPAGLRMPLRDGDVERPDDDNYAGKYFLNARTKQKPQVVDRAVCPILDPEEFYSGCYGNVSLVFYPYSASGNKGISAGLGNVQKIKDGERMDGGVSAKADFGTMGYANAQDNGAQDDDYLADIL